MPLVPTCPLLGTNFLFRIFRNHPKNPAKAGFFVAFFRLSIPRDAMTSAGIQQFDGIAV